MECSEITITIRRVSEAAARIKPAIETIVDIEDIGANWIRAAASLTRRVVIVPTHLTSRYRCVPSRSFDRGL